MARLRLVSAVGRPRNEIFSLGDMTVIGRGSTSQIVLNNPSVSKEHACVVSTDEGYFIEDMKSLNGTLLNGEMIQSSVLKGGDVIRIHDFELEFIADAKTKRPRVELPPSFLSPLSTLSSVSSLRTDSGTRVATHPSQDLTGSLSVVDPVGALRRRLEVLYGVSRLAVGNFSVESLSKVILDELFRIFYQAEYGYVLMGGGKDGALSATAYKQRDPSADELAPSRTIIEHACSGRQAVLSACALEDSRFQAAQSIVGSMTTSVLCAPVIADEETLGVIYVATRRPGRAFREDDLQLVVCVAATLAISLQNARLHEEAVQAQRLAAIGQAISKLAHCIKNILNGIQAGSFIVDRGIETDDTSKVLKGWEMTKRNNEFLSNLVLDMLSYGKERKPRYEPTDINELVQTIADLSAERAKKQGTALRYEFDQSLAPAIVDPVSIYRCVLNLVANAIDACAEKGDGQVCLRTIPADSAGRFAIRIEDTGCGMSQEVKEKLFSDFFSTKGAKGTGLGLPVVKKIVEEHGGELEVTSELDAGSVFTMYLPASREPNGD